MRRDIDHHIFSFILCYVASWHKKRPVARKESKNKPSCSILTVKNLDALLARIWASVRFIWMLRLVKKCFDNIRNHWRLNARMILKKWDVIGFCYERTSLFSWLFLMIEDLAPWEMFTLARSSDQIQDLQKLRTLILSSCWFLWWGENPKGYKEMWELREMS